MNNDLLARLQLGVHCNVLMSNEKSIIGMVQQKNWRYCLSASVKNRKH